MPLNIEARYPDEKLSIMKTLDNSKAETIYKETEEIVKWFPLPVRHSHKSHPPGVVRDKIPV